MTAAHRTAIAVTAQTRLLALVVASSGRVDPRELEELDRLQAYRRLGIDRARFVELAQEGAAHDGVQLERTGWLAGTVSSRVAGWLSEVADPAQRLLLCRLAAAVVTADGRISRGERCLFDTMLGAWGISRTMVAHAIMVDAPRGQPGAT